MKTNSNFSLQKPFSQRAKAWGKYIQKTRNSKARKYYIEHKDEINEYNRIYNIKNRIELAKKRKLRYFETKQPLKYLNNKYKTDLNFKIKCSLRSRVMMAVKSINSKKAYKTMQLIGCTIEQLKQHLQKQFKKGMTWDNYGFYGWHIDHIRPCASFDLTKPEEQKKCFNYKNLQPLWAEENRKKHTKMKSNFL